MISVQDWPLSPERPLTIEEDQHVLTHATLFVEHVTTQTRVCLEHVLHNVANCLAIDLRRGASQMTLQIGLKTTRIIVAMVPQPIRP